MTQYEVWWTEFPPPVGPRPALLLSRPEAFEYLNRFVVATVSTRVRGIPQELALGKPEGLPRISAANFDNLYTVPRDWLTKRLGRVAHSRLPEVKRALGHAFDWDELNPTATPRR